MLAHKMRMSALLRSPPHRRVTRALVAVRSVRRAGDRTGVTAKARPVSHDLALRARSFSGGFLAPLSFQAPRLALRRVAPDRPRRCLRRRHLSRTVQIGPRRCLRRRYLAGSNQSAASAWLAGDLAGVTAARRTHELRRLFHPRARRRILRAARPRTGALTPGGCSRSCVETPRGLKPRTGALTLGGALPPMRGHPERLAGLRPRL